MNTEERLVEVERSLARAERRSYLFLSIAAVLAVGVLAGLSQTDHRQPEALTAKSLVIVDAAGKPRIELAVADDAAFVKFRDQQGKCRLSMNAGPDGARLSLHDDHERSRAMLAIIKEGPSFSLIDEEDETRALFFTGKNGPMLTLMGPEGREARLAVTKEGSGLRLAQAGKKNCIDMASLSDGPSLFMTDQEGNNRCCVTVSKFGPGFTCRAPDGKPTWTAP